ncbi:MAG TPA: hypothetical protein VH741_09915, partial [Candidatus Limnocylindrales bacterium]
LTVALAAIPFLRGGDRAATVTGWQDAARLRDFALVAAIVLGVALLVALLLAGPLDTLLTWASSNLDPYGRRP